MPTDWEARYQSGDMPWEKGAPSPGLADFLATGKDLARGTVLVPGGGTGHDACAWAAAGFSVTGIDLAPSAVERSRQRAARMGLRVEFVLGDFLSGPPLQPFDWLFEHTLFCAIDKNRRDDYVQAVDRWLKPGGYYLAVNYLILDEDGPPFGTTRGEVLKLFSPKFLLLEDWVPRSYPNRTGLELMSWWQKR